MKHRLRIFGATIGGVLVFHCQNCQHSVHIRRDLLGRMQAGENVWAEANEPMRHRLMKWQVCRGRRS